MGQSISSEGTDKSRIRFKDEWYLLQDIDAHVRQRTGPAELYTIESNLNVQENGWYAKQSDASCASIFYLPADTSHPCYRTIMPFLKRICKYPVLCYNWNQDNIINNADLLRLASLLSARLLSRAFMLPITKRLEVLYIGLCDLIIDEESHERELCSIDSLTHDNHGIDIDHIEAKAENVLNFLTWCLILIHNCPAINSKINRDELYIEWTGYRKCALNILRTMNMEIINDVENHYITWIQFQETIHYECPHLLDSIGFLAEHLFYFKGDLIDYKLQSLTETTRLFNEVTVAQISACLSKENVLSRFQKLYVGREHGFSMRSMQSRVFKWKAPSLLIVRGTRVVNEMDYAHDNRRFENFLTQFPKQQLSDSNIPLAFSRKKMVTFVVYLEDYWRITNKESFGDENSKIVQLSPCHKIFIPRSNTGNIYFNTLGGGIGIGNEQPDIKFSHKRYRPGGISLTLDDALEFGVFRHEHSSSFFKPVRPPSKTGLIDYEVKFIIQDVEVWGYGDEKILEQQMKDLAWEEAEAKRRQNINLKNIDEDRALLEMAGLVEHPQSGGSV